MDRQDSRAAQQVAQHSSTADSVGVVRRGVRAVSATGEVHIGAGPASQGWLHPQGLLCSPVQWPHPTPGSMAAGARVQLWQ